MKPQKNIETFTTHKPTTSSTTQNHLNKMSCINAHISNKTHSMTFLANVTFHISLSHCLVSSFVYAYINLFLIFKKVNFFAIDRNYLIFSFSLFHIRFLLHCYCSSLSSTTLPSELLSVFVKYTHRKYKFLSVSATIMTLIKFS